MKGRSILPRVIGKNWNNLPNCFASTQELEGRIYSWILRQIHSFVYADSDIQNRLL